MFELFFAHVPAHEKESFHNEELKRALESGFKIVGTVLIPPEHSEGRFTVPHIRYVMQKETK